MPDASSHLIWMDLEMTGLEPAEDVIIEIASLVTDGELNDLIAYLAMTEPMEMPDDMDVLEMTFKMINAESQLLWSSDYPHWDMDVPSIIWDLPFLDEKAKRNILGENARKLFDIDVSDRFPDYQPMT